MIPVISVADFGTRKDIIAQEIHDACITYGFFYIKDHNVSQEIIASLKTLSAQFFSLPEEEKKQISMDKGGIAWRGFFPVNGELTSGKPDRKEGIYFGTELDTSSQKVIEKVPMHGKNLFPERPEGLRESVLEYMAQVSGLAQTVLEAIALSLGLEQDYFFQNYTKDPLVLFRIFHYPAQENDYEQWGVGEHTDYGLLTLLLQDNVGGLQVKSKSVWVDATPIEGTFICNIGDMLDKITGGYYKSNPHRVKNTSGKSRYSFPVFFDPGFETTVKHIEQLKPVDSANYERWDKTNLAEVSGTYGQYILGKVGKVFPDLLKEIL